MNTPDTEWERDLGEQLELRGITGYVNQSIIEYVRSELASRDTYWKERETDAVKVIKGAVALVQLLEHDKKLSEADYELYGYGEACAIIKVHGEKLLTPFTNKDNLK